jgi:Iron-binding zinc finger CDGSH type
MSEPTIIDKKPTVLTLKPGAYYWCSCGLSANQPYCNGSHKGTLNPSRLNSPKPSRSPFVCVSRECALLRRCPPDSLEKPVMSKAIEVYPPVKRYARL